MVVVTIAPAGRPSGLTKRFPITDEFADISTVGELKQRIHALEPRVRQFLYHWHRPSYANRMCLKLYPSRQKLSIKGDKKALADDTNLTDGMEVTIKDLGPQISWRTVFIVEYVSFLPVVQYPLANCSQGRTTAHTSAVLLLPEFVLWWSRST